MTSSRICFSTLLTVLALFSQASLAQTSPPHPASGSSELIGQLTKQLNITPAQAKGGAGILFGLAKTRLSSEDFGKISAVVPGMSGLLKAAPSSNSGSGLAGLDALPGGLGGMASAAESFHKLGLSPDMMGKFAPILSNFVQSKGGANLASLLSGALK